MAKQPKKLIANNKKVYHDYFLEETFEAGIALAGTEVKSMRMGKCSIKESFIHIENGEVILYGMHISPYEKGNIFNKDPLRPRKLLMHKKEIQKMVGKIAQKGYTIVPVEVYFKGSLVKVQVALAKERSFTISVRTLPKRPAAGSRTGFQSAESWIGVSQKTLQGLVMVSTGIMQLEKRVVRDTLNSTIKIKR